jgi:hypothetical protein
MDPDVLEIRTASIFRAGKCTKLGKSRNDHWRCFSEMSCSPELNGMRSSDPPDKSLNVYCGTAWGSAHQYAHTTPGNRLAKHVHRECDSASVRRTDGRTDRQTWHGNTRAFPIYDCGRAKMWITREIMQSPQNTVGLSHPPPTRWGYWLREFSTERRQRTGTL